VEEQEHGRNRNGDGRLPERGNNVNIFEKIPTFEEWCKANGFDPEDDENYNAYCEWKDGER